MITRPELYFYGENRRARYLEETLLNVAANVRSSRNFQSITNKITATNNYYIIFYYTL